MSRKPEKRLRCYTLCVLAHSVTTTAFELLNLRMRLLLWVADGYRGYEGGFKFAVAGGDTCMHWSTPPHVHLYVHM